MKNLLAYYYVDLLYLDQALIFGLHACIFSSKMCPKFSFIMCVSVSSENIRLFSGKINSPICHWTCILRCSIFSKTHFLFPNEIQSVFPNNQDYLVVGQWIHIQGKVTLKSNLQHFTESRVTSVLCCEIQFMPDLHNFGNFMWNHAKID